MLNLVPWKSTSGCSNSGHSDRVVQAFYSRYRGMNSSLALGLCLRLPPIDPGEQVIGQGNRRGLDVMWDASLLCALLPIENGAP